MYRIVDARDVGFKIRQYTIEAPRIARKQRPGQFVILRLHEGGERIPLTIKSADPDPPAPSPSSCSRSAKPPRCSIASRPATPFSTSSARSATPLRFSKYGTVAIVAGSVGTAMALPTARALKDSDNHVIFIEGARNRDMVIFEDEVRAAITRALHSH